MAESNLDPEDCEITPGYKPPAAKALGDIVKQDEDDESLQKYKKTLLGAAVDGAGAVGGKLEVIVKTLSVCVAGREDIVLDLTGDLSKLKDKPIVLKEGTDYRMKLTFVVNGDIVSGLRLLTVYSRAGIKESTSHMVGSYPPSEEELVFVSSQEKAPDGLLFRGLYKAKSKFIDDDKESYLEWQWVLEIKKHWPEEKGK